MQKLIIRGSLALGIAFTAFTACSSKPKKEARDTTSQNAVVEAPAVATAPTPAPVYLGANSAGLSL